MPDIEFFFDFSSPYSYLASTQVQAVAARAGVRLVARPFVLGGVFKATGNHAPIDVPAKGPYMLRDLAAWARDYGVPFVYSRHFPIHTIKALRTFLALDDERAAWQFAEAAFRAAWADDQDLADPAVLAAITTRLGHDPAQLAARIEQQDVKDRLRANTDDAIARGSFGAPTFLVGDQLFIGNDRLHFVERAAKGERIHSMD